MPTFITIGYGDRAGYDRTDIAVRDKAHAHDEQLRAAGALLGVAGKPVQVRNHGAGGTETTEGPFMSSSLPVAGFALIEATSLDEAVALAAQTPCAVAYGVVEVWPLGETP
jgi:hypothetical protein